VSVTPLARGGPNAVAVTLGLIGDEWTLLILRYALTGGATRYGDWLERLPISHAVLTDRLARLTGAGLLRRVPEGGRFAYRLSRRGGETWPILLAIWAWELAWVPDQTSQLPRMTHAACGEPFVPVLVCDACRKPAEPRDVTGRFGPSGTWERSVPAAATRRRAGSHTGPDAGLFPQTMALIGNRWSAALLGAAFLGARRFTDFAQRLGAPPTTVADRLRTFVDLGVLEPADGAYHLTAKGRAFFPVVMCMIDWGHRWFRAPEGPALVYRHPDCGDEFRPRLACDRCQHLLHGTDVVIT
jgi:DNA-binding HxlR family transcriptional regulator